jgi:small-conductance mechanosensitive channel
VTAAHRILADVLAETPTPTPRPTPSCADAHELCQYIFQRTDQVWLAEGSYLFLLKPLRILLIVLLAILARFLFHRFISKLISSTTNDSSPVLLRPLREKMPTALRDTTGALPERRRQRAAALGSVLRSIASATIFATAVLLVLSELGIDLAPMLASAGIAGLAVGFGAQNLVKDFIAGLFMLLEDQYGVGDVVDLGSASGTVEAVGLRITTVRDAQGVVWYIRNGEIVRVGNKSQGWATVIVDVPVGFAAEEATGILRRATAGLAEDPRWKDDLMEPPEVLGVEQITADGAVLRTTVKTTSEAQWRIGRELRSRLTEALERAGIADRLGGGSRVYLQPAGADATATGAADGSGVTNGFGAGHGRTDADGRSGTDGRSRADRRTDADGRSGADGRSAAAREEAAASEGAAAGGAAMGGATGAMNAAENGPMPEK